MMNFAADTTTRKDDDTEKSMFYRFDFDDVDVWKTHLEEEGYVVLRHVVSQENVDTAMELLLDDLHACSIFVYHDNELETTGQKNGAAANDTTPATPYKKRSRLPEHGILASLAQTRAPWFIRGQERIQQVFSKIWNTTDLITSMDSIILWTQEQSVQSEGLHLDQNPATKPQLDCYQGMVPLLPVTNRVGGLGVVPRSNTPQVRQSLCQDQELCLKYQGDFVTFSDDSHYCDGAILLECDAGDLILWDSRTIHGGMVGPAAGCPKSSKNQPGRIIRAAIPIAMTPRSWASPKTQALRQKGFQEGRSFNHCPHEAGTSTGTFRAWKPKKCPAVILTEQQRAVL